MKINLGFSGVGYFDGFLRVGHAGVLVGVLLAVYAFLWGAELLGKARSSLGFFGGMTDEDTEGR